MENFLGMVDDAMPHLHEDHQNHLVGRLSQLPFWRHAAETQPVVHSAFQKMNAVPEETTAAASTETKPRAGVQKVQVAQRSQPAASPQALSSPEVQHLKEGQALPLAVSESPPEVTEEPFGGPTLDRVSVHSIGVGEDKLVDDRDPERATRDEENRKHLESIVGRLEDALAALAKLSPSKIPPSISTAAHQAASALQANLLGSERNSDATALPERSTSVSNITEDTILPGEAIDSAPQSNGNSSKYTSNQSNEQVQVGGSAPSGSRPMPGWRSSGSNAGASNVVGVSNVGVSLQNSPPEPSDSLSPPPLVAPLPEFSTPTRGSQGQTQGQIIANIMRVAANKN